MTRALAVLVVTLAVVAPGFAQATQGVAGKWDGAITVGGREIPIQVTFAADAAKGTIDIQGVTGLALQNLKVDPDGVHFELPAGLGLAVFEGTLKGEAIVGKFTQGAAVGTFTLRRHKDVPVVPEPPPPYTQEEVKIVNGPITLAGTLTLPPSPGRHPAVVLITGSGPENRDEEVFGFKVFRLIADHLTRNGIAVLRCDDRGVGGSNGSTPNSTSADFADDVVAEVAFLKARPDIDAKHIGVLGHSEGGLIGPLAATRSPDIAFVVMLSGPALTGEQILLAQGAAMLKVHGATQADLDKQARTQRLLMDAAKKNDGWDAAEKQLQAEVAEQVAQLPESQRARMSEIGQQQIKGQIAAVRQPWFRFFLTYDPLPALEKLKCPVLALFGELDLQVPTADNKAAMEKVFAKARNRDVTIKVLPQANHLYQVAKTGDPAEYTTLKKEFVPELLPLLTTWIQERGGLKKTR
jgi:pimeloyl-ACP methyl ester carboxylesterase